MLIRDQYVNDKKLKEKFNSTKYKQFIHIHYAIYMEEEKWINRQRE